MVSNNLGPEAQKWARGIDSAITELQKGSNGSIEFQRNSVAQYDAISTAIKNIQEQQETLTMVVNSIPITQVHSAEHTPFSIPTGETDIVGFPIPVIPGKYKADLFVTGLVNYDADGIPQSQLPRWRIVVDPNNGGNVQRGGYGMEGYWKMSSYSSTLSFAKSVYFETANGDPMAPVNDEIFLWFQVRNISSVTIPSTSTNRLFFQAIVVFS